MNKIRHIFIVIWKILKKYVFASLRKPIKWLYVKFQAINNPPLLEDPEDEKAWKKQEDDFQKHLKKDIWFLWLFGKLESYIMWFGFFGFLLLLLLEPFHLDLIVKPLAAGAMGIGFVSWIKSKDLQKRVFERGREFIKFLSGLTTAMEEHDNIHTHHRHIMGEPEKKPKLKRAD